jgi:predicted acyltransferase
MGTPNGPRGERLLALDAFRGMTIAAMLLVNNPGTWSAIYPPLAHAPWHGWTPTDLIFPFFVFIVGITTHISSTARSRAGLDAAALTAQVLRRGGLIILLGLLLHAFPFVPITRLTELRIPGVLQRIGVCYIAAALFSRGRSSRQIWAMTAVLLLGYWGLQALVAPPGVAVATLDVPGQTLSAWLDRTIFGSHLWQQSKTWDPEGLLSTLPAIGTCLLGVLAGRRITGTDPLPARLTTLFSLGGVGMIVGLLWDLVFPINKNLWTSSYVVFTAGMACVALAMLLWLADHKGRKRALAPFVTYGLNPMLAFVGSGMMARAMGLIRFSVDGERISLQQAVYRNGFASWLDPRNASLAYAIGFVLVWYGLLRILERRGIVFRV